MFYRADGGIDGADRGNRQVAAVRDEKPEKRHHEGLCGEKRERE